MLGTSSCPIRHSKQCNILTDYSTSDSFLGNERIKSHCTLCILRVPNDENVKTHTGKRRFNFILVGLIHTQLTHILRGQLRDALRSSV